MIVKSCKRHGELEEKDIYTRKSGKTDCRICERQRGSRDRARKLLQEGSSLESKDIPKSMVEVKRVLVQITKPRKSQSGMDMRLASFNEGLIEGIRYTLDQVLVFACSN